MDGAFVVAGDPVTDGRQRGRVGLVLEELAGGLALDLTLAGHQVDHVVAVESDHAGRHQVVAADRPESVAFTVAPPELGQREGSRGLFGPGLVCRGRYAPWLTQLASDAVAVSLAASIRSSSSVSRSERISSIGSGSPLTMFSKNIFRSW